MNDKNTNEPTVIMGRKGATMFKTWDPDGNAVFFFKLAELAELADVSIEEARKCWYRDYTNLNGIEVITLR